MHPLNHSKEGEEIVVQCLHCQGEDVCRLNELGCVEGAFGTVISNQNNVIVKVGETRLAIDGKIARSILVSPLQFMAHLLSEKKVTGTFRIKNITGSETTRLMEMGIIPGMNVEIIRRAPLGYPIEIKVNGMLLTLREQEAKSIEIEG